MQVVGGAAVVWEPFIDLVHPAALRAAVKFVQIIDALDIVGSIKRRVADEVVDQPGNLNSLLKTLLETNIDIDYIYLSFNRESGCPIMVFHVPDVYETEASLKSKGYTVL